MHKVIIALAASLPWSLDQMSASTVSPFSHRSKPLRFSSLSALSLYESHSGLDKSPTQSPTSPGDHKLILPELKSRPHCPYKGSVQGLAYVRNLSMKRSKMKKTNIKSNNNNRAHLKNNHHSESSSAVVQCAKQGEPGCRQGFKDERAVHDTSKNPTRLSRRNSSNAAVLWWETWALGKLF